MKIKTLTQWINQHPGYVWLLVFVAMIAEPIIYGAK